MGYHNSNINASKPSYCVQMFCHRSQPWKCVLHTNLCFVDTDFLQLLYKNVGFVQLNAIVYHAEQFRFRFQQRNFTESLVKSHTSHI